MIPVLVEESSSKNVPQHLEVLVSSLEAPSSSDKNDLFVVLLSVLMTETGFSLQNAGDPSVCSKDHGFSVHKLTSFQSMPVNWKNRLGIYEIHFVLGRFIQYPSRLLIIPTSDVLIVNLLVSNLTQEKKSYVLGFQPSKYVVKPTSSFIPSKFCNLKDLSLKFKNSLAHPARSVILTKEGILNASLLGVPDEIKVKIFKYLSVKELLQLSVVCRDLYHVTADQGLWRDLLRKDFLSVDVLELLDQPGINTIMCWKEEYKRRYNNATRFRFSNMLVVRI